ncbi:MAG: M1 family metallopeptidase [Deltaproteobacteria bacterium]|nr:M1 family metallopeptidase [Deltaproteobacteria bacterium]
MRRALAVALLCGASLGVAGAEGQPAASAPADPAPARLAIPRLPDRAPRTADYTIHVEVDPRRHTLSGQETITWRNPTGAATAELWLHLYLNGFKHGRTSLMRERAREGLPLAGAGEWGSIDVRRLRAQGRDLTAALRFERPDDGNADDETVARVTLPQPVPPRGEVVVEIDFTAVLPRAQLRTGHAGPDFHLVAQWFPKLGVLEGERWICHQLHQTSEFYSDFGRYDVWITVPLGYQVAATGQLTGRPTPLQLDRVAHRFEQEDVHDFAFVVARGLHDLRRTYVAAEHRDGAAEGRLLRFGVPPDDVPLTDVEVRLLVATDHVGQADRVFAAAFRALTDMGYAYGRYPYHTLTIVDPPVAAFAVGGMEYPTLVTSQSTHFARGPEEGPEHTVLHEIAHQHFYGLLASNEVDEAWLDEGFTNYAAGRVLERHFGDIPRLTSYDGIPLAVRPIAGDRRSLPLYALWRDAPHATWARAVTVPFVSAWEDEVLAQGRVDELRRPAWAFLGSASYSYNAYTRPMLLLRTLEGLLGPDLMSRVMRTYAARHRFGHPRSEDFRRALAEAEVPAAVSLWDQVLGGRDELDYAVTSLRSERPAARGEGPPQGKGPANGEGGAGSGDSFESEVTVRRLGDVRAPVEVEVRFEGGERVTERWDGEATWQRFRYSRPFRVASARVDPRGLLALDRMASNNGRALVLDRRPAARHGARVLLWLQQVLAFAGGAS